MTDGHFWRFTLELLQGALSFRLKESNGGMKDRDLTPSEVTYTAVISSLTQWQLALILLKEMQDVQADLLSSIAFF